MDKLHEINWNNFKAKFNGKEQKSFEWLCYLLFCSEFGRDMGIFRYKNQAGIETEPIQHGGEVVGWQAKYLETGIGAKKDELKESIKTTKAKNPEVTKILFYLNIEFSQSSKKSQKEPVYKKDIEEYAKSLAVKVDWRVPSHLEIQLASENNLRLAQHFFSLEKSIFDFVWELRQHTESILAPIGLKILFKEKEIKIDRSATLDKLRVVLRLSHLAILTGVGGTGKTALAKELYEECKHTNPFFVFKGSEFNIASANELIARYGSFTFADFLKEHENNEEKYVVIDSAEKLSDIENHDAFQEFFSRLLKSNWRVIFTTRYSYLDDLKWQLFELFGTRAFEVLAIENITKSDLELLSTKHGFTLPHNERFLNLLLTPFYLNEYIQNYKSGNTIKTYSGFKKRIWNMKIQKSSYQKNNIHIRREKCFFEVAKRRADSGSFFIDAGRLDNEALNALKSDEIINYDSESGGYFITHDTYEEWALDKIVEIQFNESLNTRIFFQSLGCSLSIRRAFRNWLSERLLSDVERVISLIETSIKDDKIKSFWKDEILISVLLSDFAENFFKSLEKPLLENNEKLLIRIVFLLRIACKQIDEEFLQQIGLENSKEVALKSVFNIPKGKGWDFTIDFIHRHKEQFGLRNISNFMPLLTDWNNKRTTGDITKKASQIGLYYYEEIATHGGLGYPRDETEKQLIRVILQGSREIKHELSRIFDEVLSAKTTSHRDKYYPIVNTLLCSLTDSAEAVKTLPEYTIKLADLYWFREPKEGFHHSGLGVEEYFCICGKYHMKYFPASAIQTPVYRLLKYSLQSTIDFIIAFTNRTVECFVKSELGIKEVEEIELTFDGGEVIKQYVCNRLWNSHRGTQVSTNLLESIHMALEKYLLERAKATPSEILESWCKYILRNSRSASLTAVVESLVLAQPDKLFNIAKILFRTRELFVYDSSRLVLDKTLKDQLIIMKDSFPSFGDYEREFHQDDRIRACDDEHRKLSLEYLAFQYQFVKPKTNSHFEKQREEIWNIWDEYYKKLPAETQQSDSDRTWRLFLARMDTRKMTAKTQPTEEGDKVLIFFEPEIDAILKKHSEASLQRINEGWKHIPLQLWSAYRFKREREKYESYEQYNKDPHLAISEAHQIMDGFANGGEEQFLLFNHSIPAYACAVVLRDFSDSLTGDEKAFCKEVIIGFASEPLRDEGYSYQISDGVEPAVLSLPFLIKQFPEDKDGIKMTLFLLLFNPWPEISTFAISAILHELWKISPEDAQSIFLGYLVLEPKYRMLVKEVRKEYFKKQIYEFSEREVLEKFRKRYLKEIKKVISNKIRYEDAGELSNLSLKTLNTAFELIPLGTNDIIYKTFVANAFPIIAQRVMSDNQKRHPRGQINKTEDEEIDYNVKHRFFNKFAHFVLCSEKDDITKYLTPFVRSFADSRDTADFLQEFIQVENSIERYEEFWLAWNTFYQPVLEICKAGNFRYQGAQIIHNYLLAWPWWPESAKDWHSLKNREKSFFDKVSRQMGNCPPVFYSLCKILNDIGSKFLNDGIIWISDIISRSPSLALAELDRNTIYYLENLIRKYVLINRPKVKKIRMIREAVLLILNFLVERGSITGYLLREDIL